MRFTEATYKQKLRWLGIGSILLLILCYVLAIRPTIREYAGYQPSSGNKAPGNDISLQELDARNEHATAVYRQYLLDTFQASKNLLSVTSHYCKANNLQLREYKPVNLSSSDSIQVLTRIVTVEGRFIDCLKFLYELETRTGTGRVCAADLKLYADPQSKTNKLDCTIYIQNIIPDQL